MPWFMQVNLGTKKRPKWSCVRPSGGACYQYGTRDEAERVLRSCYPDAYGDRDQVRTIELDENPSHKRGE